MPRNSWLEKSRNAWETLGINQSKVMFDENTSRGKLQTEELQWVISRIPSEVQTILDAGCGPGRYTKILTERGMEVVSYDFFKKD